jgi:hypothetical protein
VATTAVAVLVSGSNRSLPIIKMTSKRDMKMTQ